MLNKALRDIPFATDITPLRHPVYPPVQMTLSDYASTTNQFPIMFAPHQNTIYAIPITPPPPSPILPTVLAVPVCTTSKDKRTRKEDDKSGGPPFKQPRGRPPSGKAWNVHDGVWENISFPTTSEKKDEVMETGREGIVEI